jgi:hypothetical protein
MFFKVFKCINIMGQSAWIAPPLYLPIRAKLGKPGDAKPRVMLMTAGLPKEVEDLLAACLLFMKMGFFQHCPVRKLQGC